MTVKLIMFVIFSNRWSFLFITSEMSALFCFGFCFAKAYYIVTFLGIFFFVFNSNIIKQQGFSVYYIFASVKTSGLHHTMRLMD